MTERKTDYVMITTQHRGVFAGDLVEEYDGGRTVTLRNARCAIRWATTKGLFELARSGPNAKSLIGDVAPEITLYDVTSLSRMTPEAEAAWRAA